MKLKITTKVALSVFALALASIFMSEYFSPAAANDPNPPSGRSGSPADGGTCTNCHGSATTSYTVALTGLPSNGYISGTQYTMTLTMTSGLTSNIAYGFEISPQTTSTTRTFIGTVATNDANTRVPATGYITNTSRKGGNTTGYTWTFKWTAPGNTNQTAANATGGKGNGNFYGSFMFCNNDGNNNSSDHPKNTSFAITENTTASISIASSATTICSGSSVTFTATPVNQGTSPTYLWQVNGSAAPGTNNGTTYTSSSLSNGDIVTCQLTSSKTGVSGSPATSNQIAMTVNASPSITGTTDGSRCGTGSVTLGATSDVGTVNWYTGSSGGSAVATGTSYPTPSISSTTTYYVDATNAGCTTATRSSVVATVNPLPTASINGSATVCQNDANPTITLTGANATAPYTFTYSINGGANQTITTTSGNSATVSVPTNTAGTFTYSLISVQESSSGSCSQAQSGSATVTVNPPVTPSVSIALTSGTNPGCPNQSLTFTASPTNGGASPSYQWQVNGSPAGSNSNTFTSSSIADQNAVQCILTSNANCATTTTVTSNSITYTVSTVTPSVSIAVTAGSNVSCNGQSTTFTAYPINGGASPSYLWQVNGGSVGTNSNTFTSSSLADQDVVDCILTSNDACASPSTATSNSITMTISSSITPAISIALTSGTNPSCQGDALTFTASASGEGTSPTYQWLLDGNPVGSNSAIFSSSSITNGQAITCNLTSSSSCANPSSASSNTITVSRTTVVPAVSIALTSGTNPGCPGQALQFTATPTYGGSTPTYIWKVNGSTVGTNSNTFSSSSLNDQDAVSCVLTSNDACASTSTATSNTVTITISTVTPSVAIAINSGSNPTCINQPVTFTATPTNGGSAPTYQWQVNGSDIVGQTGATYSSSALTNGQNVTCVMTSNLSCASPLTATSSPVTMTVNSVTPSVSIAVTSGTNPTCAGQSVTFTASPTNGGVAPTYQWKVNGNNVGTGSTYTSSSLNDTEVITCVLTPDGTVCSNASTATSSPITMTINPTVTPAVSIAITSGSNPSCLNASVTFSATPNNGGAAPAYQWKVNGNNVGNGATYTTTSLANSNTVTCVLTSNAGCTSTPTATSSPITMTVSSSLVPAVSIALTSGANPTCSGQSVSFTASPTNGGGTPSYQWKVNGNNAGSGGAIFTTTSLADGETVSCMMTSSSGCANPTTATSNGVAMTVYQNGPPTISIGIASGVNPSCTGSAITFTATATNVGTAPVYQWQENGVNVGSNSATYTINDVAHNTTVTCILMSNSPCANPRIVTSNAINITAIDRVTPDVSIAVTNGTNPSCSGSSVTFTASSNNGGNNPVYQWQINRVNVGTNSTTYSSSSLSSNDTVVCILASDAACATNAITSSNQIIMTVGASLTPAVTISTSTNSINAGSSVTFTATPANGGLAPSYQWKINGTNAGTNSPIFTTTSLNTNGQRVNCIMTSNLSCASASTATSNTITMVIVPQVPVITQNGNTLTSSVATGNQWYLNGSPIAGATGQTYTAVENGVYSVTTSGVNGSASSTPLNVTNIPSITASGTYLQSSSSTGSYQWYMNGSPMPGETGQTFNAIQNGVYMVMIIQNGMSTFSAPVAVAVEPAIMQTDSTTLTSSSAIGNTWYLDGVLLPDTTQNLTINQNGTYKLVVTINGVSSETAMVVDNISAGGNATGINQLSGTDIISISPNPNNGNFTINFNVSNNDNYRLDISDMLGQIVYSETLNNFSGNYNKKISINTGKGVYVISLISSKNKFISKAVVY